MSSSPHAPDLARERATAEAAVRQAAKLTKAVLCRVSALAKHDASPVTVADFAAQALIISLVRAAFPADGFVGEEDAAVLRADAGLRGRVYELFAAAHAEALASSASADAPPPPPSVDDMLDLIDLGGRGPGGPRGRFWALDPVDGTAAFLRGEQYAVSLALVRDGLEVLGVLALPNLRLADGRVRESSVDAHGLGIMLSAVRGQGASLMALPSPDSPLVPRPLPQLAAAPADPARLHVVDCHLNSAASRHVMTQLAARLGAPFPGTDVWSSHVRYAALIVGGGDLLLRIPSPSKGKSCVWDHAGAQLIYAEVGGKVTDLDGKPIDFGAGRCLSHNRGIVAAKPDIHETVLSLAKALAQAELNAHGPDRGPQ